MGAAVEQGANFAVAVARDDERAQAEFAGDEIVVFRNLTLVRQVDPGAAEYLRHFPREDVGVGVDQPVDAILLHELVPLITRSGLETRGWKLFEHAGLLRAHYRAFRRNRNTRPAPIRSARH